MDRERRYRRLLRIAGGVTTVLAEDDFVYQKDQDYLITIEAIGTSLRVHQDRAPVFAVEDASMSQGRIGLYCWANQGARFSDVTVDDYRADAPVPYRFKFTTSAFVNFLHHLHSYQDETWRIDLPAGTDIAPEVAQAVTSAPAISEPQTRAYESLASTIAAGARPPSHGPLRVTRVDQEGNALAFWVEGPEPIDWARTDVAVAL